MNEEHDDVDGRPGGDPDQLPTVDDREQTRISSLLAAAAGAGPENRMPPEVAARLDDVLAGLVSERTETSERTGPSPTGDVVGVTDLASRRRRRRSTLLVAAAAVSVLGLGLGNVMDDLAGVQSDSATAGRAADGDAGGGAEEAGAADSSSDSDSAASAPAPAAADPEAAKDRASEELSTASQRTLRGEGYTGTVARPPRLRTDSLAVDLERAEVFSLAVPADEASPDLQRACVQPAMTEGDEWLRVRLDGDPGVLVLRAPDDGRRTADVFTCDDDDTPAVSVRIDAR